MSKPEENGNKRDAELVMKAVENGTARYSNTYNDVAESGAPFDLTGIDKVECFPYVRLSIGFDIYKDIDDDPLHTSLPSDTYNGVAYTHSDNCLVAKYPKVAAQLFPIARKFIQAQYSVSNVVLETLVVDAIGGLLAASAKAYSIILAEARVRSGYHVLDEHRNYFGTWLLSDLDSEFGKFDGIAANAATFKTDLAVPLTAQDSGIAYYQSLHYESISKFDDSMNAYIENFYMSNRVRAVLKLLCSTVIQGRFADADSQRYYVFSNDEQLAEHLMSFDDAAAKVKTYANNHCKVFLHRYTFLPELLSYIGVYQLDSERDKVIISKAANYIKIIADDKDAIKNMVDHMSMTYDDINSPGNDTKEFMRDAIFVEADAYLNGELELRDHVDVHDDILTVWMKDGLRAYNVKAFEVSKAGNAVIPDMISSVMIPKPFMASAIAIAALSDAQVGAFNAANCVINTSKIIDPTITIEYTSASSVLDVSKFVFRTAMNTYLSPRYEQRLIAQNCLLRTVFDWKKLSDANSKLAQSETAGNDVA